MKSKQFYFLIPFAIVAAMAAWNLGVARTLWMDEAMLALNFRERPTLRLLQPLAYNQVAPIGFLLVEKCFGVLGDFSNLSLRIFPFLGFLTGWLGFYKGLHEIFKDSKGWPELLGLLYGLTFSPLTYSVEVKQYTFDMLIWSWAFYGLAAWLNGQIDLTRRSHLLGLSLVGSGFLLFSNVAVIILFAAGSGVLIHLFRLKRWGEMKPAMLMLASWVGTFGIYYLLFIHQHPGRAFMLKYWSRIDAFMPMNAEAFTWLQKTLNDYFAFVFSLPYEEVRGGIIWAILAGIGWISGRKSWALTAFLLIPLLAHLGLSGLQMYPFRSRLALWHLPSLVVGWGMFLSIFKPNPRPLLSALPLVLLVLLNFRHTVQKMPYSKFDLQPILDELARQSGPDDVLYYTFSAHPTLKFESHRDPHFPNIDHPIGNWDLGKVDLHMLSAAPDTAFFLSYCMHPFYADSVSRWCGENGRTFERLASGDGSELYRLVNKP